MAESFWLQSEDKEVELHVSSWTKKHATPTGIIQISHGMVEHIKRYDDFARFLVEQGYFVVGHDHRGHGQTGLKQGTLGYLSSEHGFDKLVQDLHTVTKHIKQMYPDIPIILFSHSMGSFVARKYMQLYAFDVDGIILSGTGYFPQVLSILGKQLAKTLPSKKESKLFNLLAFGSYNKRIVDPHTTFDWLTRDDEEVDKYIEDPLCGFTPTGRFFYDLMSGLYDIHHVKGKQSIQPTLPLLIISGDRDPVGSYGKGPWQVAKLYERMGYKQITVQLFPDARHEILNELNKSEVYERILHWIDHTLKFSRL